MPEKTAVDRIAESFVKLALALGAHDPFYVDAYFGPEAWREDAKKERRSLKEIQQAVAPLVEGLKAMKAGEGNDLFRLRRSLLIKQLESLAARASMLDGAKLSFDQESKALYDAVARRSDEREFRKIVDKIDSFVPPGEGTLLDRLGRYKRNFVIPKDRLDAVFAAAIAEARRRTKEQFILPENEAFTVEFVTGQPWGAYNWYKGANHSVIQINTDLPKYIDDPLDLACHEGYPGHHVQNLMYDQGLVKEKGWIEFTVFPLYCPISLINEGAANFGVEVAFPDASRRAFERDVLYPIAGLNPSEAEKYGEIRRLQKELRYAEVEAARSYLDGKISREMATQYLSSNALMPVDRARRLVDFFDRYRSYIITYNAGYDLVKSFVESRGGTARNPAKQWEAFRFLVSLPLVPAELK